MTFLARAQARYSCRAFTNEPIDRDRVCRLLETVRYAPTACNNWPVTLYVVASAEGCDRLRQATTSHFGAPLFIVVVADRDKAWVRSYDGVSSAIDDASIVGTHLMFAVEEEGLGTTWVKHFDPERVREVLALAPHQEPVALFPIGVKAKTAAPSPRHSKRPRVCDMSVWL